MLRMPGRAVQGGRPRPSANYPQGKASRGLQARPRGWLEVGCALSGRAARAGQQATERPHTAHTLTAKPCYSPAPPSATQACYKALAEAGIERVQHLDRGIYGWYQADLPFTGDYKVGGRLQGEGVDWGF